MHVDAAIDVDGRLATTRGHLGEYDLTVTVGDKVVARECRTLTHDDASVAIQTP